MRARCLLALTCLPLACGETDDDDTSIPGNDAAIECATSCPPCPSGTQCLSAGSFGKPIIPACVKLCAASDECGPDQKCVLLDANTKGKAYCISSTLPAKCGEYESGHCDFFGYDECHDASTLRTGVSKLGVFCGLELTRCPNGCGGADGGIYPGTCL